MKLTLVGRLLGLFAGWREFGHQLSVWELVTDAPGEVLQALVPVPAVHKHLWIASDYLPSCIYLSALLRIWVKLTRYDMISDLDSHLPELTESPTKDAHPDLFPTSSRPVPSWTKNYRHKKPPTHPPCSAGKPGSLCRSKQP